VKPELFERPRRRMKQPTKDALRERITLLEGELARTKIEADRLQAEIEARRPWWRRMFARESGSGG
jgi:hypothetical protein